MTRRADVVARLPVVLAYDRVQAAVGVSCCTFDKWSIPVGCRNR